MGMKVYNMQNEFNEYTKESLGFDIYKVKDQLMDASDKKLEVLKEIRDKM